MHFIRDSKKGGKESLMLFCSESRLIPTNVNLMTLEKQDMYFYVHRSLYDQAVILNDKYKGKEEELLRLLDKDLSEVPQCISYFRLVVPEPLSILGNFLTLIDNYEQLNVEIDVLCGVIHQMSGALNFRNLIMVPKELRASVAFSLSLQEEYLLSWNRFFQESIPYDESVLLSGRGVSTSVSAKTEIHTSEEPVTDLEDVLANDEPPIDWESIANGPDLSEPVEEKNKEIVVDVGKDIDESEDDDGVDVLLQLA